MENKYNLLTASELGQMKSVFDQVGDDPQYIVAKKLYAYIKELGAVREDVYEYLMEDMVFQLDSINILNTLLKTFAAPEWFELIKKTEKRKLEDNVTRHNIMLFQQMIIDAYRDGVPFGFVEESFECARFPYEMSRRLEVFNRNKDMELGDVIGGLKAVLAELQSDRQKYEESYRKISETAREKDETIRQLQEELTRVKEVGQRIEPVPEDYPESDDTEEVYTSDYEAASDEDTAPEETYLEEDVPEMRQMGNDSLELVEMLRKENAMLLERIAKQHEDFMNLMQSILPGQASGQNLAPAPVPEQEEEPLAEAAETEEELIRFIAEESQYEDGDDEEDEYEYDLEDTEPEIPDLFSKLIKVTEKKENPEDMRRVTLFQKIKEHKKRSAFEKLTEQKKLEILFQMMKEREYSEKMILAARQCLLLKVSFEFLYSFIEMDVTEDDFKKLILFRDTENKIPIPTETETSNTEDKPEGGSVEHTEAGGDGD